MVEDNPVKWFKERFKVEHIKMLDPDGLTAITFENVSVHIELESIYILKDDTMFIVPLKRLLELKLSGEYMKDICKEMEIGAKSQYPQIFAVKKGPGAEVG